MDNNFIIFLIIILFSSLLSLKLLEKFINFSAKFMRNSYNKYNLTYHNNYLINKNNGLKFYIGNVHGININSSLGKYNANNKDITNRLLKKNNIPVPNQFVYDRNKSLDNNLTEIKKLLDKGYFKFPLVVKPSNGTQGYGVFVNLNSIIDLKNKIIFLIKKRKNPIIEQQVFGDNFRIMVYNNRIIDVIKREVPYVIGNGTDTIKLLVKKYNNNQKKNNNYSVHNLTMDLIKDQGYTLYSILPKNKKIMITNTINYHNGSGLIRIPINSIHKDNIKMFLKTNKVLNLNLSGIDYISSSLKNSYLNDGNILEVNTGPDMKIHYVADKNQKNYPLNRFFSKLSEDLNP